MSLIRSDLGKDCGDVHNKEARTLERSAARYGLEQERKPLNGRLCQPPNSIFYLLLYLFAVEPGALPPLATSLICTASSLYAYPAEPAS